MNKRILISLSVVAAVAAIAIGGNVAYFSDIERSEGNILTAGRIDISIDGQNPWTRTYSDLLKDMKPSEWRDYYFLIHNEGTNPADIWKHLKVTETSTGILTEPECDEQGGIWKNGKCTFPEGKEDRNDIDKVITYDLYIQTAWDKCNNGTGYSEPGPTTGAGQCVSGGQPDCCWGFQRVHIHDLGKLITKADLIIDYVPGYYDGCTDTMTVGTSLDGTTWTKVEEKTVVSKRINGGWQTYRQKLYGIKNFRYVKMSIPTCYIDYSAVYALEPIIAPEEGVKVSDINSCWIYLGRLKPSERMFVEQSYHMQPEVTNWAQGDIMKFDIELLAQQMRAPNPEKICPMVKARIPPELD